MVAVVGALAILFARAPRDAPPAVAPAIREGLVLQLDRRDAPRPFPLPEPLDPHALPLVGGTSTLALASTFAEAPPARPAAWFSSPLPAALFAAGRDAERPAPARTPGAQSTDPRIGDSLRWLLRHQQPDGSWTVVQAERAPPGCLEPVLCAGAEPVLDQGAVERERPGATALAALALIAAGWTPLDDCLLPDALGTRGTLGTLGGRGNLGDSRAPAGVVGVLHEPGVALERALSFLAAGAQFAERPWSATDQAQVAAALAAAALRTNSVRWRSAARRAAGALGEAAADGAGPRDEADLADPHWARLARALCATVDGIAAGSPVAPLTPLAPVTLGAPVAPGAPALAALEQALRAGLGDDGHEAAGGQGGAPPAGADTCQSGTPSGSRGAGAPRAQAAGCALSVLALAGGGWSAPAAPAAWVAAAADPAGALPAEDPRLAAEDLEREIARLAAVAAGPSAAAALQSARLHSALGEESLRAAGLAELRGDPSSRASWREQAGLAFARAAGLFDDLARSSQPGPGIPGTDDGGLSIEALLGAARAELGRALATEDSANRGRALAAAEAHLGAAVLERDPLGLRSALALSACALELRGNTAAALAEWELLCALPDSARLDPAPAAFGACAVGTAEAWRRASALRRAELAAGAGAGAGAEAGAGSSADSSTEERRGTGIDSPLDDLALLARLAGPRAGQELLDEAAQHFLERGDLVGCEVLRAALAELDQEAALALHGRMLLAETAAPEPAAARAAAAALAARAATAESVALSRRALPGCAPATAQQLLAEAGATALAAGWTDEARALFAEARARAPLGEFGPELLARAIDLELAAGCVPQAEALLGELVGGYPEARGTLDAAWFRARIRAARDGESATAGTVLDELLAVPADAPHALLARVQAREIGGARVAARNAGGLGDSGELAAAADLAARCCAADARAAADEVERGWIETQLAALEEAAYARAVMRLGAAPEIAAARAWLALGRGDFELAEAQLTRAQRSAPGHPRLATAWNDLALELDRVASLASGAGDEQTAVRMWRSAARAYAAGATGAASDPSMLGSVAERVLSMAAYLASGSRDARDAARELRATAEGLLEGAGDSSARWPRLLGESRLARGACEQAYRGLAAAARGRGWSQAPGELAPLAGGVRHAEDADQAEDNGLLLALADAAARSAITAGSGASARRAEAASIYAGISAATRPSELAWWRAELGLLGLSHAAGDERGAWHHARALERAGTPAADLERSAPADFALWRTLAAEAPSNRSTADA